MSYSLAHRLIRCATILVACLPGFSCIENTSIFKTPNRPSRNLEAITQVIEANSSLLNQPVWSTSVSATARVRDEKSKEHVYNLEGTLLFDKPQNLRMDLRPSIGEQAIGIGSNTYEYWVWIEPELHAMRWGQHRNSGRPCAGRMTIRADQLITAMGMGGLPPASAGVTGPELKAGKRHDILTYYRQGGQKLVDREYWVSREAPFLIRVVVLKDTSGRQLMSALLDDYKPMWPNGPLAPHTVSIDWPLDKTHFTMQVGAFKQIEPGQIRPTTFARPQGQTMPKGITDIVQIDDDCGGATD
jgi:hypothetical protein